MNVQGAKVAMPRDLHRLHALAPQPLTDRDFQVNTGRSESPLALILNYSYSSFSFMIS